MMNATEYAPCRMRSRKCLPMLFTSATLAFTVPGQAAGVTVASATNFAEVLEKLEPDFERRSGHQLTVVSGSTGKLYAQIANGAPFDVLLAADEDRPRLLETEGVAVRNSRFTYAIGRLVLWSPDAALVDGAGTLKSGSFRRLAIANPDLAPYGAAARETLEAIGLYEQLRERIVVGENVGQAWAMVATGNAELGFVALSYVRSPRNEVEGSRWEVPQDLHTPIRQDAVLLKRASGNAAARAFMQWLRQAEAASVIEAFGYTVE